jgi:hypothetical protein
MQDSNPRGPAPTRFPSPYRTCFGSFVSGHLSQRAGLENVCGRPRTAVTETKTETTVRVSADDQTPMRVRIYALCKQYGSVGKSTIAFHLPPSAVLRCAGCCSSATSRKSASSVHCREPVEENQTA